MESGEAEVRRRKEEVDETGRRRRNNRSLSLSLSLSPVKLVQVHQRGAALGAPAAPAAPAAASLLALAASEEEEGRDRQAGGQPGGSHFEFFLFVESIDKKQMRSLFSFSLSPLLSLFSFAAASAASTRRRGIQREDSRRNSCCSSRCRERERSGEKERRLRTVAADRTFLFLC